VPLVWVLHAAYLWVPIHLLLRGLGELGWIALPSPRTPYGRRGRRPDHRHDDPHRTRPHRPAVARRPLRDLLLCIRPSRRRGARRAAAVAPGLTLAAILGSAALWSAGFGLYAIRYAPLLTRPRADGQPG
jgi:uncharacterized protein involved in response to NO